MEGHKREGRGGHPCSDLTDTLRPVYRCIYNGWGVLCTISRNNALTRQFDPCKYCLSNSATIAMAPNTPAADAVEAHQQMLDQLDLTFKPRSFRNARWKPSQRRNRNIKQIVAEASRKEASVMATQNNSGTSTPNLQSTGAVTPMPTNSAIQYSNISQAAQNLSTMVLERNLQNSVSSGPVATYTNIESAPSLHPAHQRRYCDITGFPAPYTDPKSRLRYHNKEVFDVVRHLPQGQAERYLEARGAHVVLK